jgi:hypothetical protein
MIAIQIDRYTADADHQTIVDAWKAGGYPSFLDALRQAPAIGAVRIGDRSVTIRWARESPRGDGRRIVLVTEAPVYFFGAGAVDAPPTEGFDTAVLELIVDSVGLGSGSMAAAAKIRPGGPTGVQIDDYSGKRIELVSVARDHSKSS